MLKEETDRVKGEPRRWKIVEVKGVKSFMKVNFEDLQELGRKVEAPLFATHSQLSI
jgi:hypothetical protein